MKKIIPTEHDEQMAVVQYLELRNIKFTSIPNSTFTKSWKVKKRNKEEGLRAGLPDLFIIIKNKPLFIEMKREKGGVVSEYQKEWIEAINKCSGIKAYICKGFEEAKKIIDKYL